MYFPAELPQAAGKNLAENNNTVVGEQRPRAEPQVLAAEASAPAAEEMPLALVVEPQAPAWAQHIVHFLQTRELPDKQEEAKKVACQSSMYQFVDNLWITFCTKKDRTV
jgi:hypothetical protein